MLVPTIVFWSIAIVCLQYNWHSLCDCVGDDRCGDEVWGWSLLTFIFHICWLFEGEVYWHSYFIFVDCLPRTQSQSRWCEGLITWFPLHWLILLSPHFSLIGRLKAASEVEKYICVCVCPLTRPHTQFFYWLVLNSLKLSAAMWCVQCSAPN